MRHPAKLSFPNS